MKTVIRDTFKGINLLTDDEHLQKGECVDCNNLFIENGVLRTRKFFDHAVEVGTTPIIWADRFQVGITDTYQNTILALNADGYLYRIRFNGTFEVVGVGATNIISHPRALQWDEKVLLFGDGYVYIVEGYNTTTVTQFTELVYDNTISVEDGLPGFNYGFEGTAEWAFVITDVATGRSVTVYYPTATLMPRPGNWSYKFLFPRETWMEDRQLTIRVYRRDLEDDVAPEAYYFYCNTVNIAASNNQNPIQVISGVDKQRKNFDDAINPNELAIPTDNLLSAAWYQNRVVWGTTDGNLIISKRGDPFTTTVDLSEIYCTKKRDSIFYMREVLGTLFIFTSDGIWHLTGTVADLILDGNFSLYQNAAEIVCSDAMKLTVKGTNMYFPARDGFYQYNGQTPRLLSRKVDSTTFRFVTQGTPKIVVDEQNKLILMGNTTHVYVYHYENDNQIDETYTPRVGAWTRMTPLVRAMTTLQTNDKENLVVIIGTDNKVRIQQSDIPTATEPELVWSWVSQTFVPDDYTYYKWEELRLTLEDTATVRVTCDDEQEFVYDPAEGKMGVFRFRIKRRSKKMAFRLTGNTVNVFHSFGIDFKELGVR